MRRSSTMICSMDLKKALAERLLNTEMDVHLGQETEQAEGNHRNGVSTQTVLTDTGKFELAIPRGRQGRFEPALIAKYQRRFPGFDQKIIALYARGMTTRDIQAHLRELYGIEISPELVSARCSTRWRRGRRGRWSRCTDRVLRLLAHQDPRRRAVKNKAVSLAIGMRCSGHKEVLGIWIEQTEGAKFWLRVMTEIRNRGTHDVLIAVVDGLKGFPEAINAVFPEELVQTCIVHLIRYSMQFASWKERKAIAAALRPIYGAESATAAAARLDEFDAGPWGEKYPAIAQSWRRNWEQVIPFFAFPAAVRRIIYTTNAIESLHSEVRKAVRGRGHFPSDEAATKLIWLALRNITAKWKNPPIQWHAAKAQFAIQFEARFVMTRG
jgi:putative transposase